MTGRSKAAGSTAGMGGHGLLVAFIGNLHVFESGLVGKGSPGARRIVKTENISKSILNGYQKPSNAVTLKRSNRLDLAYSQNY